MECVELAEASPYRSIMVMEELPGPKATVSATQRHRGEGSGGYPSSCSTEAHNRPSFHIKVHAGGRGGAGFGALLAHPSESCNPTERMGLMDPAGAHPGSLTPFLTRAMHPVRKEARHGPVPQHIVGGQSALCGEHNIEADFEHNRYRGFRIHPLGSPQPPLPSVSCLACRGRIALGILSAGRSTTLCIVAG